MRGKPVSHNVYTVYRQNNLLDVVALTKKAIRLFPRKSYLERDRVQHLRRAWIDAITRLGTRWNLHPCHRQGRVSL